MHRNKLDAITATIDELLADSTEAPSPALKETELKGINAKVLDVLGINVQVRDAETYKDL